MQQHTQLKQNQLLLQQRNFSCKEGKNRIKNIT